MKQQLDSVIATRNSNPDNEEGPFSVEDHSYANDQLYKSIGLNAQQQQGLYDDDIPTPSRKNNISKDLSKHIKKFVDNEKEYGLLLDKLIELRNYSFNFHYKTSLKYLNPIKDIHEKLLQEFIQQESPVTSGDIAKVIIKHESELQCYIEHIRITQSNKETVDKNLGKNYKDIQKTYKRIFYYLLTLQSWIDLSHETQHKSLNEAVKILKSQCRAADTALIVNSIESCPYNLMTQGSLIKHNEFSVRGKSFKNKRKYNILMFETILLFCNFLKAGYSCHEAIHFERIHLLETNKKESSLQVKLNVNHGLRRGTEIIQLCGTEQVVVDNWKREILKILSRPVAAE